MTHLPMNIIAAVDTCFGIGKNNKLPWHLPKEYAHFVQMTTSTREPGKMNAVVMGRKCWESIPERFRPLKNRLNVILSRSMEPMVTEQIIISKDIDEAIQLLSTNELFKDKIETIWNVGGHDIYAIGLTHPQLQKVVVTKINKNFDCDVKFPEVDWNQFETDIDCENVCLAAEEKGVKWHVLSYTKKMSS